MAEKLDKYILKNGMVLLGEQMEAVESVAFGFMLPAGAARLPQGCCGAANVIADWIFRGAADKDNKQLGDALDGLGLHRAEAVSSSHITIGAALEATNLAKALELYADIILEAHLKDEHFELARQLALDRVRALDDEPRQKVILKLQEQFYPPPLGRSTVGTVEELKALKAEKTRQIIKDNLIPAGAGAIFAVAGKYDFNAICRQMESLMQNTEYRRQNTEFKMQNVELRAQSPKYTHIENDSAQVHIGLMTGTVRPGDDNYYNGRVAVSVLSGGMSARLFTEVREKRGLCYAVGARYHALKEAAGIMCYAGTTPEKAQQTLDVIIGEFNRLSEGISQEELDRAKAGLKSSLILHSESSSSRAGGIATDYYMLGRVRSLDEIKDRIEQTTVDSVLDFLRGQKFGDFTVVTIGPKEVDI